MEDKDIPKKPLSGNEYGALRALFGFTSTMAIMEGRLEKRLKETPHGWRDWRLLETVSYNLLERLMLTIPIHKVAQIRAELAHTRCYAEVKREFCNPAIDYDEKELTYMPLRPFERIMAIAVNSECLFCDKTGKAAKKCSLRADFNAVYKFDLEPELREVGRDGECPFAGWVIEEGDNNGRSQSNDR